LSLPDDVFRQAKVLAATLDTSVSALVVEALGRMVGPDTYDAMWRRGIAVR
jgi:hypothetical protein